MTRELPPEDKNEPEPGSGAVAKMLFPSGLAQTRSFVDRVAEYRRLKDDVVEGRNAWFDCPPRYGVTSLTARVLKDLKPWIRPRIAWANCRLNAVHDVYSFSEALLECIGQLASQVIRRPNVLERNVEKMFIGVRKELYLDEKLLQTIRLYPGDDPLGTLRAVAPELEALAAERGCRPVFLVHDLQQLLAIRGCDSLLETMRYSIDRGPSASWLMHGNNRHAMRRLFLAEDSPLQGCCARFALRRINISIYSQFLADAAQARWRCFIGRKATAMILTLTDRHPLWFNELCRRLWSSDLPPVIQDVVDEWIALVDEHRHISSREMERLSPNQRAVLACLAATPTDQPRAKAFVRRTRVSSASVGQAIRILAEQDLIRKDADGVWLVADPVMQWALYPRHDVVEDIYQTRSGVDW